MEVKEEVGRTPAPSNINRGRYPFAWRQLALRVAGRVLFDNRKGELSREHRHEHARPTLCRPGRAKREPGPSSVSICPPWVPARARSARLAGTTAERIWLNETNGRTGRTKPMRVSAKTLGRRARFREDEATEGDRSIISLRCIRISQAEQGVFPPPGVPPWPPRPTLRPAHTLSP